jgi:RNA polymerase sigma-70 factor (ECF subfamily)
MMPPERETWFEEFCRQEYPALCRYTYSCVGNVDETQEIVQESFLAFYRMLQAGAVREHERALLFRLARNHAIDLVRRHATRQHFAQELRGGKLVAFRPAEPLTPEEILLEKERRLCADKALTQLSSRDQDCLALRRNGLTYREVAEVLHLNPKSVGQIISRALLRFERVYEQLLGRTNDEREKSDGGRR